MIGKYVSFALLACGFAIVAVPSEDAEQAASEHTKKASSEASPFGGSQVRANSDWLAGDHTLDRQPDGHFYASAMVDGAPVRMMVDTGASVIALTGQDASAAGLYWDDSQIKEIGRGASGSVYGVRTRLNEVEIGGIVRRNVTAVIVPNGLDISLLGQSYLSQIGAVEIADNKMVMSAN